jgi:hypothetical protein
VEMLRKKHKASAARDFTRHVARNMLHKLKSEAF